MDKTHQIEIIRLLKEVIPTEISQNISEKLVASTRMAAKPNHMGKLVVEFYIIVKVGRPFFVDTLSVEGY